MGEKLRCPFKKERIYEHGGRNAWYDHLTAVALNHVARPSTTADACIASTRYLPGGSPFDLSVPALQKKDIGRRLCWKRFDMSMRRRIALHLRKRLLGWGVVHGDLAPQWGASKICPGARKGCLDVVA